MMGVMIESHINAGNQALVPGRELKYGVSITDACVDFQETEVLLNDLYSAVTARRQIENDTDTLAQFRHKIDEIDKTVESLILERARQAMEVAKVKKSEEGNATMYRPEREQAILRKVLERNDGPISDGNMEEIFRLIMSACLDVEK